MPSFTAEHTSCAVRSRAAMLIPSKISTGSKSVISPPFLLDIFDVSKTLISLMPDLPLTRLDQKASLPTPIGETTPRPVMTIRFCTGLPPFSQRKDRTITAKCKRVTQHRFDPVFPGYVGNVIKIAIRVRL